MTTGRDDISHRDRLNVEEENAKALKELGQQLEAQDEQGIFAAYKELQKVLPSKIKRNDLDVGPASYFKKDMKKAVLQQYAD